MFVQFVDCCLSFFIVAHSEPTLHSFLKDVGKQLLTLFFHYIHILSCSESGEMCAMKEVTLFSDDPKSKESVKQLAQVSYSNVLHP